MTEAQSRSWRRLLGPAILCFAALIATAPQIVRGNTCGHDFDFHLVSWFDALQNWHQGIVYPHWSPNSNFGAGEPRFIFYPPISWMLGAAFGAILRWNVAPLALTALFLALTGLATRALARRLMSEGPATLAGCAAIFSGYALFTAYERSDFGELTGGFWVPLILLLALRERNSATTLVRRAFDGSTALLALAIAGAWLSNAPLGVMTCYLLAGVALLLALLRRSWAPIVRSSTAVVLGLGITTFYWLPALVEQRWADMSQILNDPGYTIENNWLFARHADPALALHDAELLKASFIAVTMLAVTLIGLFLCWRRGKMRGQSDWWLPLAAIPIVVLLLQLPLSDFVWNTLPNLRFLQFPWRWLVVLQAPMGIFFAAAVWMNRKLRRTVVVSGSIALFLAATLVAGFNFFQTCDDEDAVWAMVDTYRTGAGFVGTDEYEPPYADNTQLAANLPFACFTTSPTTSLGQGSAGGDLEWSADQHSCEATFSSAPTLGLPPAEHLRVNATAAHSGALILRLRNYPAWQVRLNGILQTSLPHRNDGLIAIPVSQGSITVTADWATTSDVRLSRWISLLALALLIATLFVERKPSAAHLS
ncbi:MAG TPA: 6-pyruvoyl-tetrahydropterin synthase-related protein [Terracidiphilus sp.]|jgi:hypothetical protein|nr:6-pyruvoyl-tetrahydropterin synthase-related protein [Terracidiphilus sp.]